MNSPLKLYTVTLPWSHSDNEMGDYASSVWAESEDEAIRLVAEEMATADDMNDTFRSIFVRQQIEKAGHYCTELAAQSMLDDLEQLMKGPQSEPLRREDQQLLEQLRERFIGESAPSLRDRNASRPMI